MTLEERFDLLGSQLAAYEEKLDQTLEQDDEITDRVMRTWDYRQILNHMGRYASYHFYGEHARTYDFFSHTDPRTTAELGSTGVYADMDKIYQMFIVFHEYHNFNYTAHCHPLTTPYIQVAKDRETAKVFMLTNGFECLPGNEKGQLCLWFYDGYDMVYVLEDNEWKWLKFHMVDDIKAPFYVSWGEAGKRPGPKPDGLVPPSYEHPASFQPYSYSRKPSLCVTLPEPYDTYE